MADRFFIVDGSAFAYRSFFAVKGLTDSRGRPTNAAFGFIRVLLKILREHAPSHIAVVFDAPGKGFRHDMYAEYKATRAKMPEELAAQLPMLDRLVEALRIPLLRIDGVEADDVIATLARRAEEQGMDVVVVTGDKDMLQLVGEHVQVYDPYKDDGTWYDSDKVRERYGCPPGNVVDALALMGDSSDNVPGVRGIGEKTARSLLEQYGDLDGVYEHIGEIKGKRRERLEQDRANAELSKRLVTLDTAVALDVSPGDCVRGETDNQLLVEVFDELEFQSLLGEVDGNPTQQEQQRDYRLVNTIEQLDEAVERMRAAGRFAVDTETTSTDPMRAGLVGVSLSCAAHTGYYIPVGHTKPERVDGVEPRQLPKEVVLDRLRPLLEDPSVEKAGHNIKYDMTVLSRAGIQLAGIGLDTMVCSYLTDPSRLRHNLNDVSLHYLKCKTIPISDLIGKGVKAVTFDQVPLDDASEYACEDADVTWRLAEVFEPLLRERGVETLYRDVELPLIDVLARMERAGVAIDRPFFDSLRRQVQEKLDVLEKQIFETAGEPFQINSPKQLQEILFNKLGLKPVRKTKTGYSTDMEVLEQLAPLHSLPELILEYRALEKLRGTYIEALPKLIHPETGRIHTSFNQAVTATGRLSSSDPNLQNIPVRTEFGRKIREGFVPGKPGYQLISADYSQIELRILAHLSRDAALMEAFREDADIHTDTAARVFGVMPGLVTPEMRRQAKAVNFGVIYGISAYGLARNLRISQPAAARFIEQYFEQYPDVRVWIGKTIEDAEEKGYVTTLLNRRRYVPELARSKGSQRRAAERVTMNTPVQGSAADLIKLAMLRVDAALADTGAAMLLQVHDELLLEAPEEEAPTVAQMVKTIMEGVFELEVPLKVDIGIGANWAVIH